MTDITRIPQPQFDPLDALTSHFLLAFGHLMQGLRSIHQSTRPKIDFTAYARSIRERQSESDLAKDLFDQFIGNEVESDKLGHFIETALADAFYAEQEYDRGSKEAWRHLCHAYFVAGMATLQINITRGAYLRTRNFKPLADRMLLLVRECEGKTFPSREALWRHLEADVDKANGKKGDPGYYSNPRAKFDEVARENPEIFQPLITRKSSGGKASKKSAAEGSRRGR